jgi:hypothetical protein
VRGFARHALAAFAIAASATAVAAPLVWGIHAHEPARIPGAAAAGYTAIRLWDTRTTWADLKPDRQSWQFDRIAAALQASETAGLKVLWTLGSTPRWASARPAEKCPYGFGCGAEPRNMEDWRRYVFMVATTFKGRVECYEPWNEVSFPHDGGFERAGAGGDAEGFFTGSVAAMVEIARIAYEEIKRADPAACVTTPSFHNSGDMAAKLDRYLAAGGGRYADAVSMHFYFGAAPEAANGDIRVIRRVLARHGLGGLPVWNTEVGVNFLEQAAHKPGSGTPELVYSMILRTYLLNAAEGIRRVYWYAWDNGQFGFFDRERKLDFGSDAAAAALRAISGIEHVECGQAAGIWRCQASGPGRRFLAVWAVGAELPRRQYLAEGDAARWGRVPEAFKAGQRVALDERPLIIDMRP